MALTLYPKALAMKKGTLWIQVSLKELDKKLSGSTSSKTFLRGLVGCTVKPELRVVEEKRSTEVCLLWDYKDQFHTQVKEVP